MPKRSRVHTSDFQVVWICALQVEVDAARAVLDEEYDDLHQAASYILGRIGWHNVVIACPPAGRIGPVSAAVTAERAKSIFSATQHWLMVGVGAGVPSPSQDIRLGDVVISQPQGCFGGVVQYDSGKMRPEGQQHTGFLNAPSQELLVAVTKLRSNINTNNSGLQSRLTYLLSKGLFPQPPSESDVLFQASYDHATSDPDCERCNHEQAVPRPLRSHDRPVLHYGLIASGNSVMRKGRARDSISKAFGGVLCFDMEAAGLMNSVPCLVVRGICDYADSHKNKQWQPYAAVVAACCARELVLNITSGSLSTKYHHKGGKWSSDSSPCLTAVHYDPKASYVSSIIDLPSLYNAESEMTLTKAVLTESQRAQLFRSLRFDQLEYRYLSVKPPHSETCQWLLNKLEFRCWADDNKLQDHNGHLWIKGKAATGKSTMMKFLLHHLKRAEPATYTLAFFFDAKGNDIEKSIIGMYRSILYQLLEQCPELRSVFDLCTTAFNAHETPVWTVESLQILFRSAIERLGDGSLVCVVDALDECNDDAETQSVVKYFNELCRKALVSQKKVRMLFSSRLYPYIDTDNGILLVLEDQKEHSQDIATYLQSELKAGTSLKIQQIREQVLERASGIFLWVELVVKLLNSAYRRGRIAAIEEELEGIPDDIESLLHKILYRGGICSEETLLCIQWVLCSERPLKVEELYFAIWTLLRPQSIVAWDRSEIPKNVMEKYVLDASKGLAEVSVAEPRRVQFIHETVREFFFHGKGLSEAPFAPADKFWLRTHKQLMETCLIHCLHAYKEVINPWITRESTDEEIEWCLENAERFPFLRYATREVLLHINYIQEARKSRWEEFSPVGKKNWMELCCIYHKDPWRKEYLDNLIYVLADQGLSVLFRYILQDTRAVQQLDERHQWLVLAGLVHRHSLNLKISLALLSNGLKPSQMPSELHLVDESIKDAMKFLREKRCTVYEQPLETPLIWAIRMNHAHLVQLMLAYPTIDIYAEDEHGDNAFNVALSHNSYHVLQVLLVYAHSVIDGTPWHFLAGHSTLESPDLFSLVSESIDYNSYDLSHV